MRFIFDKEHPGKLVLIATSVSMWILILFLFQTLGYNPTWRLWKVPADTIPFLDFRLIPGSAESFSHGYEPTIENPYDPGGRPFNYPAFWRLFFYTGITLTDTVWMSITMIILFFIGVFLFPENLSISGAIGMLLVVFSPAAMLLYERGNADLIAFFICALAVFAGSYSAYIAAILIAFGTIVKLFPFFGVSILLREPRNKFLILFLCCFLVLVVYMLATWSSVVAAWTTTARGGTLSYGTNVFVTRFEPAISKTFQSGLRQH